MSRLHRLIAAPALAGALMIAPAIVAPALLPGAVAHDGLVGAVPGDGAVITTAPEKVELTFSASPRDTFDTVALSRDGEVLVSGAPRIEANVLTLDIPANVQMTDGNYIVGYQITSSDGHATRGSYSFTLNTGGADAAQSTDQDNQNSSESRTSDDGLPSWSGPAIAIASFLVLAGVVVMLFLQRRRSGH